MDTQTFLNILNQHKEKSLLFEYAPDLFVAANYHITEVKHITIDSVDCGAQTDSWRETIIQLWESPKEIEKKEFMKTYKALSILNKVGKMKPYIQNSELKIEYSNATFHTTQQFIKSIDAEDSNLIVRLTLDKTSCKAQDICGVPEQDLEGVTESNCCSTVGDCC